MINALSFGLSAIIVGTATLILRAIKQGRDARKDD